MSGPAAFIAVPVYGGNPFYADIDDPGSAPANLDSGIYQVHGPVGDVGTFVMHGSLVGSKSFRLGILANNQGAETVDATDLSPDSFRVHQTNVVATSATIPGTNQDKLAHWFFFDIEGAVADDAFALEISSDGFTGAIGGLTFDTLTAPVPELTAPVPEPSTFVMTSLAFVGLTLRRRRRARG